MKILTYGYSGLKIEEVDAETFEEANQILRQKNREYRINKKNNDGEYKRP